MGAVLAPIVAWPQWSFTLDTTFRTAITMKNVNAVHVLQGGKIFASGLIRFAGDLSDRGSVRLLPDGQRDLGFPQFPATTGGGKIVPWLNGKFYVAAFNPRRMMPDGLIDPSFGPLGIGPYFQSSTIGDYHVYPDGRVLISGQHQLSDSVRGFVGSYDLIWFSNTGYLDTTATHRQSNGVMWRFAELTDGKFICSCTCTQYEGQPVDRVFRIQPDGALDTTFHSGINWGNIFAYHPLPDGRVYVGGRFKRAAAPNDTLYLVRLMPDGSLDPTFTPPALAPCVPPSNLGVGVTHLLEWESGHMIVTGQFGAINGGPRSGICMLDSTGGLNPAFDMSGVGPFTYQGSIYASIDHAVRQGQDTLYVCGAYAGYTDGTISDAQQRFVSRLLVSELSTQVAERGQPAMHVYPNPAGGSATLDLEQVPPNARLLLRDALGRPVLHRAVRDHRTTLDLAPLANGCYTLQLLAGSEPIAIHKVIVQH